MSMHQEAKLAEAIERQRLTFAFFFFLIGIGRAVQALEYYYNRQDYPIVNFVHNAAGLAQLGGFTLIVIGFFQILSRSRGLASTPGRSMLAESFVEKTNLTALGVSWLVTFVLALVLAEWTEPAVLFFGPHDPASLRPPTFYLDLLIGGMTTSYGAALFLLIRRNADAIDPVAP